jgi:hypothetical protein
MNRFFKCCGTLNINIRTIDARKSLENHEKRTAPVRGPGRPDRQETSHCEGYVGCGACGATIIVGTLLTVLRDGNTNQPAARARKAPGELLALQSAGIFDVPEDERAQENRGGERDCVPQKSAGQ